MEVADQLFLGSVREEKIAAVFLLEKLDAEFGDREYKLFESWLGRISNWAIMMRSSITALRRCWLQNRHG